MPIPSYKKINIKNESKTEVFDQLNNTSFEVVPHILNIEHISNQKLALAHIEEYLQSFEIRIFPYPIYVITKLANQYETKNFITLESEGLIPHFFKQKIKVPNSKEANALNKISLKQVNLKTLMYSEDIEGIHEYARGHKKLYESVVEGQFLETLLSKLKVQYEQKRK